MNESAIEIDFLNFRTGRSNTEPKSPSSLEEAYKIQGNNALKLGQIVGWKLGGTNRATRELFKTDDLYYGPIFNGNLFEVGNEAAIPDIPYDSPMGELEIAFALSSEISDVQASLLQNENTDIERSIQSVFPSIELPWSLCSLPDAGLNTLIADQCASGSVILGDSLDMRSMNPVEFELRATLSTGDSVLVSANSSEIIGGPLSALKDFLIMASKHGLVLKQGQVVCTGGITPCVLLPRNIPLLADMQHLGSFKFELI